MKKYQVEITSLAESDILSARAYIARDKPQAASAWQSTLEERILGLETFPMGCEVIPEARFFGGAYRHLLVGNYRVIFRMDGECVIVLRVVHAARELLGSMLP